MRELLQEWASINSFSYSLTGLAELRESIRDCAAVLGADVRELELRAQEVVDSSGRVVRKELGKALWIRKRPEAPRRIFLGIHMDTVYPPEHVFPLRIEGQKLCGPAVADAKGGLVVMLTALEAWERSAAASRIGWEALINPDEEIGSPGSGPLFAEAARRNNWGLLFEPSWEDGSLVSHRRGSGNFTLVVRGRAAHAGRDPEAGRNAIHVLAGLIVALQAMASAHITVNVGKVEGGGPVNVVPDLAIGRFNVRVDDQAQQRQVERELAQIVQQYDGRDGIGVELHGGFHCPPKAIDERTERLLEVIRECGRELGLELSWRGSGGVSDGNKLAAGGLPTVDSLGVRGGGIHSDGEYMMLDSLVERAKLAVMVIMRLAEE